MLIIINTTYYTQPYVRPIRKSCQNLSNELSTGVVKTCKRLPFLLAKGNWRLLPNWWVYHLNVYWSKNANVRLFYCQKALTNGNPTYLCVYDLNVYWQKHANFCLFYWQTEKVYLHLNLASRYDRPFTVSTIAALYLACKLTL